MGRKSYNRKRYLKNRKQWLERAKQRYLENREVILERVRNYYQKNKEKIQEKLKWRRKNDPKYRNNLKKQYLKGLKRKWEGNWWKCQKRDNHKCRICNEDKGMFDTKRHKVRFNLDVHHIDGNDKNHNLENLITLCHFCHHFISRHSYLKSSPNYKLLTELIIKQKRGGDND